MNDIIKLIRQKENRQLEFKRELPVNEKIIKTAIAFSNSQGGDLIIGLDDDNQVIGIDEDNIIKYEEIISSTIYDSCYPAIIPEIYSVRSQGKILLIVHFYPSNQKPHYIKSDGKIDGTYVRVGSSNRKATIEIIEELERQKRRIGFDSVVNYDIEYQGNIFKAFDNHIVTRLKQKPSLEVYNKLKLLKLERDKYFLTNLGILFSEMKNDYFPLVKIECARFKGTSTKAFLDQATFDKDIISSIEKSIDFVKRNIKLGATIGEVYRENRWEYPLLAIREAIINAVVHRDYSVIGSDIKIAIFDDMIEITNPGVFLIDKEKIGKGYSELRNVNLGDLFKKFKIIEQWGTGFEKIFKELKEYPEIDFEIDDESSFTQIKFLKKTVIERVAVSGKIVTLETAQETAQESTRNLIICLLKENPKYTKNDLMNILKKGDGTIKEHLAKLKKDGILQRKGSTKGGYWEIND